MRETHGQTDPLEPVVILGAGDFGRDVASIVESINRLEPRYEILGFLDEHNRTSVTLLRRGYKVLGKDAHLDSVDASALIAIASPQIKKRVDKHILRSGNISPVLIHPDATVAPDARLGPGTIVSAGARISSNVETGRHVHINVNVVVGHDSSLGDYVTLNPSSAVSANVKLDSEVIMGTGAVIIQGLTVGRRATIGPSSAALNDIGDATTVLGVPAKTVFGSRG